MSVHARRQYPLPANPPLPANSPLPQGQTQALQHTASAIAGAQNTPGHQWCAAQAASTAALEGETSSRCLLSPCVQTPPGQPPKHTSIISTLPRTVLIHCKGRQSPRPATSRPRSCTTLCCCPGCCPGTRLDVWHSTARRSLALRSRPSLRLVAVGQGEGPQVCTSSRETLDCLWGCKACCHVRPCRVQPAAALISSAAQPSSQPAASATG